MTKLLTLRDVENVTTLKRSKIYQLIKEGKFPHQIKISANRSAWLEADISRWIEKCTNRQEAGGQS